MSIDVTKYLANRLKYHAASRVATQEGQSLAQALNLDTHTVTSQKVWAGALSGFPVNTSAAKGTTDGVAASIDLVTVFKQGATSAAWYGDDATLGVVWTNTNYPNVKLFENVIMTPVKGSDEVNSGKTVYESYEILNGVTLPTPGTPIEGKTRVQDWVSPMAVFDSSNGKPVPGYTARIEASTSTTGTFTDLHLLKSDWALANGTWEFIYSAGMVTFAKGYTPIGQSANVLRFTGFQYIGEYLDDSLTSKDAKVAADIAVVSGSVDNLSGKVEDAFGIGSKVVVSKEDGITKSEVTIGGATLGTDASSSVLATEAAVRNAIDTKSISVEGIEAVGVSGTSTEKSIYLTIDSADKVLSQSTSGLLANLQIKKYTEGLASGVAAEYALVGRDGVELGSRISIERDRFLSGAYYDPEKHQLVFKFYTVSGTVTSTVIDLSGLVDIYDGASGIASIKTTSGITFTGVVDELSEKYLTVGANGFKLSGVQNAITSYVNTASTFLSTAIDEVSAAFDANVEAVATSAAGFAKADSEISAAVAASAVTFAENISTLSTNLGESSAAASTDSAFGRIASLEEKVGDKSVATQISEYDAANIDPRLDVLESKLKDIAAEDGSVLSAINAAKTAAVASAKEYTDGQISTLEGKAAASAVAVSTAFETWKTDVYTTDLATLESNAAGSAIAASAAAYNAASSDLNTFKTSQYATLSGRVDTIDAAIVGYTSANAISNKFDAVDAAIAQASKGSSQALSTFITGTYQPERNYLSGAIDTAREDLSSYVQEASGNLVDYTDTAKEAAITSAKSYTDTEVTSARSDLSSYVQEASGNLQTYTDTAKEAAITSAKSYTDTEVTSVRSDLSSYVEAASGNLVSYTDTAKEAAITSAKSYATTEVTSARSDLSSYVQEASGNLQTYTDTAKEAAITSAKSYTTTEVTSARSDLSGYVQEASGNLQTYTDEKISGLGKVFKFKGYTSDRTSATLPTATSATIGDVYLVDVTIDSVTETAQVVGVSGTSGTPAVTYYTWQQLGVKTSVGTYATKTYVDQKDAELLSTITDVSGVLNTNITAVDTKLTAVSTAVAASAVTFDTNIAANTAKLDGVDSTVTGYVSTEINGISGTIDNKFVTKDVFSTVASNIKSDNETLANQYEQLETKLSNLLDEIKG